MPVPYQGKGQHPAGEVVTLKNGRSAQIQPNGQMRFVSTNTPQRGGFSLFGNSDRKNHEEFILVYYGTQSANPKKVYLELGKVLVDVMKREHHTKSSLDNKALLIAGEEFMDHIRE